MRVLLPRLRAGTPLANYLDRLIGDLEQTFARVQGLTEDIELSTVVSQSTGVERTQRIILRSPNGKRWKLKVDDAGAVRAEEV